MLSSTCASCASSTTSPTPSTARSPPRKRCARRMGRIFAITSSRSPAHIRPGTPPNWSDPNLHWMHCFVSDGPISDARLKPEEQGGGCLSCRRLRLRARSGLSGNILCLKWNFQAWDLPDIPLNDIGRAGDDAVHKDPPAIAAINLYQGKLLRVPAEDSAAAAALHFGHAFYGGVGICARGQHGWGHRRISPG